MIVLLLSITALAWDGEHLYVARAGGVEIVRDGKVIGKLGDDARTVMGLAWREGRLAECGGRAGEMGEVRIWEGRKLLRTIEAHDELIYRIAWSADGRRLYTAGHDRKIGVIDAESGRVEGYLEGHTGPVYALAVHGDFVATGGADRTIRIWKDRKLVRSIANHWEPVHALAFSPDGRFLASGSADRTVRLWQPELGRLVRIVRDHEGTVLDLAWTSRHLVSACSDGKVRLIASDDVTIEKVHAEHRDWVNALCAVGDRIHSGDASGRLHSR